MQTQTMQQGANIIIHDWMNVQTGEKVLIVTDPQHQQEAEMLQQCAAKINAQATVYLVPKEAAKEVAHFDPLQELLQQANVIVGATHYSIVTSKVVSNNVDHNTRFLSLPLSTNNGQSLLEFPFLQMNPDETTAMAQILLAQINNATSLRVETPSGTNLHFRKKGRNGSFFNGKTDFIRRFASASFEVYVPVEEDQTFGLGFIDGSLGYLGKVNTPFSIQLEKGRIVSIEKTADGERLAEYLESFDDTNLYHASEFGIGLNKKAHCVGNSYIEDESAYGTFHIGFGRNLALGGHHEANGHFDIVLKKPTIYADDTMIIKNGTIIEF